MSLNGNLYLTGFMGSGKSAVGRCLAGLLGRRLVETDQMAAESLGRDIPRAFAELGEEAFRRAESRALGRLARRRRLVVATGGGLPAQAANRRLMRASGRVVHLEAGLAACAARVQAQGGGRPLWQGAGQAAALLESRREAYGEHDLAVEADQAPPAELAARIAQGLFPAPELEADLGGRACPVRAGWQAHAQAAELARGRRVVLLTDRNLQGLHLERYQKALGRCLVLAVPAGEASKSLSRLGGLHRRLAEARVSRHDLLLGVGGGMVTDLAAFAASTYMRGMPFALCATSLVGCVDAAVGGKAAVNVGPHKNLAGLFTRPEAVLLDLAALASLPRRRIAEGLAEALKTGLALDAGLFELVEAGLPRALAGDTPLLARIAALAAAAKARVVGRDFREAGPRQVLNLGHTFGHALEGFHRYRLSHGRAVAAGLVVAAAVSARRGLIGPELYGRVLAACRRLLPRRLAWPAPAQAWELMASDKKNRGGRVSFVLLAGLGRARVCRDLGLPELDRALAQAEEDLHG